MFYTMILLTVKAEYEYLGYAELSDGDILDYP
jgi:hypothetical protein